MTAGCASLKTGLVTVNGHSISYSCGGSGPQVVFLAGLGGDHSLWPIADRVRGKAYACTYDRWGDGASGRPDHRTTAVDDAVDLHALLGGEPLRRPAVLVGHSYGGLLAYYMAQLHPEDVAGIVLVDASHPDQQDRFTAVMTDEQRAFLEQQSNPDPEGQVRPDFLASLEAVKQVHGPLGDLPLTVIAATAGMSGEDCATLPCAEMQGVWGDLQSEYVSLSSTARLVEAPTGHYVHDEDPDLVVAEILSLLERSFAEAT